MRIQTLSSVYVPYKSAQSYDIDLEKSFGSYYYHDVTLMFTE